MSVGALSHTFVRANGLRFHVAEQGSGDRLALCLHGFPESWFSWRHQMPHLASLGYRVWAPDLRGYGRTDRPKGVSSYSIDALVADVGGLIDASGARSVTLLGHDWGGAVAWAAAIQRVRPLERLVVMNCPHPALFFQGLRSFAQLRRSWYMFFFQLPWLPERMLSADGYAAIGKAFRGMAVDKSRFPDEVLDEYKRDASNPGALTAMLSYYRAMFRGRPVSRMRALTREKLDVPTLLIWGEEDAALGKELTYGTDRVVERLDTRYLPGVSHWVQQEAPEAVNRILAEWLAQGDN
jgi:pimeloyl-ACP methyl ester carboxylesterase